MKYYIEAFKKYAEFTGRTSRKGFWMFVLISLIISIIISFLDTAFGLDYSSDRGVLSDLYSLAVLIPSLAIGVRRMHDTDRSGWWILFPLVNLIMFTQKGTNGDNKHGHPAQL